MPSATAVPIGEGVWRIPTAPFDLVNSFAIVDDDGSVTLVDCGVKKAPARIVAGLASIGKAPSDVTRIVLTHAHGDHAGGAAGMAERTGRPVDIHEDDVRYAVTGVRPGSDPSLTSGRLMNRLGGGGFTPFAVGEHLHDGQVLAAAGGLRVIHTPGHSPGHVSLLLEQRGVLITGDAIFNVRRLRWPILAFCSDVALTKKTAHLLAEVEYSAAGFTHGPHIARDARERVRAFLVDAR